MFEVFITRPLGYIIRVIYELVQNYGLAIILFTIFVKLLLLPLQIKSQKAMNKQRKIQPIIAELQKKYANDQQRLSQEMMKVYKENNISMSGGCLPLLIQMPILFGLYRVIQRPLTYIKGLDFETEAILNTASEIFEGAKAAFGNTLGNLANSPLEQIVKHSQINLSTWAEKLGTFGEEWIVNFNFLGLNLAEIPSTSIAPILSGNFSDMGRVLLILIPALAVLTTWLSTKQTQSLSGQTQTQSNEDNPAASMSKSMNLMMPIMTGFFTFTLPSGIGIYWIISSVMQMAQQFILNKYLDRKEDDFVVKVPEKNRKNSKKRRRS